MNDAPVLIKRYPNRRYYARNSSKYVSLKEIEEMVQAGKTIEIRDSQTGNDLTQAVLTQIIMDRHPERMSLFPSNMLHYMLRSNDVMLAFLGDYFRHSQTYLDYLQRQNPTAATLLPISWVNNWLEKVSSTMATEDQPTPAPDAAQLAQRVKQLEERLEELESEER
jgi:polyhydroxyalkanoate synthesis repressor PhaR